jgi:hypothetical protein
VLIVILICVALLSTVIWVAVLDRRITAAIDRYRRDEDPPLRPGPRDGIILEDLMAARQHFEEGTPQPLPPLAPTPSQDP